MQAILYVTYLIIKRNSSKLNIHERSMVVVAASIRGLLKQASLNQSGNRGRGLSLNLINIHARVFTKSMRRDSGRYGIAYVSGRERLVGFGCSSV